MIYTLTMNPAIDYYMQIDTDLIDGEVNRANEIQFKAAGKGINVSVVLNELKIDSVAIALLGGFTGYFIKEQFENYEHIQEKWPCKRWIKLSGYASHLPMELNPINMDKYEYKFLTRNKSITN